MNIGIITHNYPSNPEERKDAGILVYDFAQELAKHENVHILAPDHGGKKWGHGRAQVSWFDWGVGKGKLGSWKLLNPVSLLYFAKLMFYWRRSGVQFVETKKIDFVLAVWAIPSGLVALSVKKSTTIPYAIWSLGSDLNVYARIPILRQLVIACLKEANVRFGNSYALVNKSKKLSQKRSVFMPGLSEFEITSIAAATLPKGKMKFLFVGRLEKVKGPDILIEALGELKRKDNFHLYFLGDGTMRKGTEDRVAELGMKKNVTFEGWADKRKVAAYMKSVDYLIVPSRNEGTPLVLIEAAKAGLPFIVTTAGDCARIVRKYRCGLVTQKEDPRKLSRMISNAIKRGRKSRNKYKPGLSRIVKDYTQEEAVRVFLSNIRGNNSLNETKI